MTLPWGTDAPGSEVVLTQEELREHGGRDHSEEVTGMKSATLVVALAITLAGCADRDSRAREHTVSPTAPTPEETMNLDARYVSTIKKGTRGSIADEPEHIIVGVPNVTTDGRTALAVTIQGEGAYGTIYLSDGEDFQIKGVPFHIETFPERGEVTVYQLADDSGESSAPPSP